MNRTGPNIAVVIGLCLLWAGPASAGDPNDYVFTYQGRLMNGDEPVNDSADFEFMLYDAETEGKMVGMCKEFMVPVEDGLFTVDLNFGEGVFTGQPRWLEISFWLKSGGDHQTLSPRQAVRPAPYAMYAFDSAGGSGGDGSWDDCTSGIWYGEGNVGIGQQAAGNMALKVIPDPNDYGIYVNAGYSSAGTAIIGLSEKSGGTGLFGRAEDTYGINYGVHGITNSDEGYAGYFEGRGYFSGNFGLGVTNPTQKLDIDGTAKMTGFQMPTGAQQDYVLTTDPNGVATWQPGGGSGSSPWSLNGPVVYYNNGNVGIGTSTPYSRLSVLETDTYAITGQCTGEETEGHLGGESAGAEGSGPWYGVIGTSDGTAGIGVKGEATAIIGANRGVYGRSYSTSGRGVYGYASASSGQNAGVLGESMSPDGYGVWGHNDDDGETGDAIGVYGSSNSTSGTGVKGDTYGPDGYGVFGNNAATTGNAVGVYGQTGAASGFGGYFVGRGYFSNNVGIGTASPASKLSVVGTVESLNGGFKFPDGSIQTTAATGSGGESLWTEGGGGDIYYADGQVGIGLTYASYPLHVSSDGYNTGYFVNTNPSAAAYAVYATASGTGSSAVYGTATASSGTNYGVQGRSSSSSGRGVYGYNSSGGYAVYGYAGSTGWAGYFYGDAYVWGDMGIGTASPQAKLDVNGTVRMDGFKLDSSSTSGYVLTCDSSGNGTWQEPAGGGEEFTLPYEGSISVNDAAFQVSNSSTGIIAHGVVAKLTSPSSHSDASAGYFDAQGGGYAIYATADGTAVSARCDGVGNAYYGTSNVTGGARFTCSGVDGYGVMGQAYASSGLDTVGGWFESSSSNGKGVYAYVDGDYGTAVKAIAEGGEGVGLHAEAPWNGVVAKGGLNAAKFYGDVRVYEYGTSNQIFRVNDSTGVTSVDVLQITGGSDLAEPFDVSEQAEPGTVVEIDPDNPGKLRIARGAYNRRVAGVISGANGVNVGMMLADLPGSVNSMPIALSGRVWVRCDASVKAVEPGDLLTTAELAGHAMPVMDHGRAHGAVIGKAMSTLAQGETGMVLVLVNLQ